MLEESHHAIETLDKIASYLQLGRDEQFLLGNECTVYLVDVIYRTISTLMSLGQGSPTFELTDKIDRLKWFLRTHFTSRWPLAGKFSGALFIWLCSQDSTDAILGTYLSIVEMQEAIFAAKTL